MAPRSHYIVVLLAGVALGVVLTIIGLTQGWFSRTGLVRDSRQPSGENNAIPDDTRDTAVAATRPQARVLPSPPVVLEHQSDDEDESQGGSPAGTASENVAQGGKKTETASLATKPVAESKLVAGNTTVHETERGPVALFRFSPTTTDPIGPVVVVAFLPPGSDAKILGLSPVGNTAYSQSDTRMAENGWFAVFQGTPEHTTDLAFQLLVSRPVVATIKGNCGIEPFEIDLRPSRADDPAGPTRDTWTPRSNSP